MEAKVDVRKLQLLNDRINQTIEALNQVRLSVHGLAHSSGQPLGPTGVQQPSAGFGFAPQAYASPFTTPYQAQPGVQAQFMPQQQVPWGQPASGIGGLSHSSAQETDYERQMATIRACDPNRVAVTFPYAFSI